jgi:DNA ligase (NAD+)
MSDSFSQDMYLLECLGFNVVTKQDWKEFPTDGKVFRVDNYEDFKNYGETSKHPKGAYAFKERSAGVPTTLLDVVWQTGKSGKVTPVAILDQIEIEGAKITQATLNNIKYIEDLGLEIGCTVTVERAGGIIPRVIKRI